MKFEELLMQRSEDQQHRRLALEEEVKTLQAELEGEETLRNVLHYALNGPLLSNPSFSTYLPPQIQVLLSEIVMVEEEIYLLERKVDEITMQLYQERAQGSGLDLRHQKRVWQQNHLLSEAKIGSVLDDNRSRSHNYEVLRKERVNGDRRASLSSASDTRSSFSNREIAELTRKDSGRRRRRGKVENASYIMKPNELSEELLKCLISIFVELNQTSVDREGSPIVPKLTLSCMNSKGFIGKTSFNCKPPAFLFNYNSSFSDPYGILPDLDIRDAFLEHGLPTSQEKLLQLMNKATLNVGGIILNALAIEHFILRYPSKSKHKGPAYEKEVLLRNAYGLGYPEPNVTFALCRGTWSSPAVRVYTPDNIVNEMERAKVEYLEASVGITSRKKIIVPKLLEWYMSDFADDMESLLEWIYSQLPRCGSLKRLMMECLNGETKSPINKMVEVQPYESEFRYMLPS
uniref:DUF547 domain-containing protein n=1 Tax=Cannabis sativa TaxID=3483 RepID=A0A803P1J4_CANSA